MAASGINDHIDIDVNMYPNPANLFCCLQSAVFIKQSSIVEICDFNGRQLLFEQFHSGAEKVVVNVSQLQSGIYLCRIRTETGNATKKIIIQK
jgi:aminopeptidase YwaD